MSSEYRHERISEIHIEVFHVPALDWDDCEVNTLKPASPPRWSFFKNHLDLTNVSKSET